MMKKSVLCKLLSITLAFAVTISSVSIPARAQEPDSVDAEKFEESILTDEAFFNDEETEPEVEVTEDEILPEEDEELPEDEEPSEDEELPADEDVPEEAPEDAPEVEVIDDEETDATEEETEEILEVNSPEEAAEEVSSDKAPVKDGEKKAEATYTVVYDANLPAGIQDGDFYGDIKDKDELECVVGESFIFSGEEFYLLGYELKGWEYKNSKNKTVTVKTPAAIVDSLSDTAGSVVTVKAKWAVATYTITYNLNGGKLLGGKKAKVTYKLTSETRKRQPLYNYKEDKDGNFVINTEYPDVVKPGCVFQGWNMDGGYYGGNRIGNISVTAKWGYLTSNIIFDTDGGTLFGSSTYSGTLYYDSVYSGKTYIPEKPGYDFKGWTATIGGKEKTYAPKKDIKAKDFFDQVKDSITFKAKWAPKTYKLKFNLGDAKVDGKLPKTYKAGDTVVLPKVSYDGYPFIRWDAYNSDWEYMNEDVFDGSGIIKPGCYGDLTIYPTCDEEYTYTFEFYNHDGTQKYNYVDYGYCHYELRVDFSHATFLIESTEDIKGSIKGYATEPGGPIKYYVDKEYNHIAAKDKDGEVLKLYAVLSDEYHILLYGGGGTPVETYITYKAGDKDVKLPTNIKRKGYKFTGWKPYPGYHGSSALICDDNGYVKGINTAEPANVILTADFDPTYFFTLTLMPGASDVKNIRTSQTVKSSGEMYVAVDGCKSFSWDSDAYYEFPNMMNFSDWRREGYTFRGFGVKNTKDWTDYVGLFMFVGDGKSKNVKIYAKWQPDESTVTYSSDIAVIRGTDTITRAQEDLSLSVSEELIQEYGTALTTKKLSLEGYTFKGWKLVSEKTAKTSVTYTDKTNTYVKSINKNNDSPITLQAVFEEYSYSIYVDPDGGSFNGKAGKQLVRNVYYSQAVPDIIEDIYQHSSKAGYTVSNVTTVKGNRSGNLKLSYYSGGQWVSGYSRYPGKFTSKNKGQITLYPLFDKVTGIDGVKCKAKAYDQGNKLAMSANQFVSYGYCLEFEYSTDPTFKKNVQVARVTEGDVNYTVVDIPEEHGTYYVRARFGKKDSTGDYYFSSFSAVSRALKSY
jgi:uncharacterized repeat protein (TIGR02543 family)